VTSLPDVEGLAEDATGVAVEAFVGGAGTVSVKL
jgi:hypothetical protein